MSTQNLLDMKCGNCDWHYLEMQACSLHTNWEDLPDEWKHFQHDTDICEDFEEKEASRE